ncbi:hypothetical protein NL676_023366 [Syzygium grande]|nr:hypothetical protein NL676_023366 [Syzygium grande]
MSRAEPEMPSAIPLGFVGSEEVAGSAPHLVPGGNLARPSLEAQGMRTNAALEAAHTPISQFPNLIAGGHQAANFRGCYRSSTSMARSLSHLDSNPAFTFSEGCS